MSTETPLFLESTGYCPCCPGPANFRSAYYWLRDHYLCTKCGSIPRERALMWCLDHFFPTWPALYIHESSPVHRGASARLARECKGYVASQYFANVPGGTIHHGNRCENLERLSFADESVDLHVSQDVFEHLFHPDAAFREIARTLKPGGAHVFTTPLTEKHKPSQICATLGENGSVIYYGKPEYHGNPVSEQGSLLTVRWGYDICHYIHQACGLYTTIVHLENHEQGIIAEYIEVMITRKLLGANIPSSPTHGIGVPLP